MKFNVINKFIPCFYILLSAISIFLFFASFINISILGISENISGFELIFNYGNAKGEHGSYSAFAFFILIIISFIQYIIYACSFKETKDSLFFNILIWFLTISVSVLGYLLIDLTVLQGDNETIKFFDGFNSYGGGLISIIIINHLITLTQFILFIYFRKNNQKNYVIEENKTLIKMKELKGLKDKGYITEDEFEEKRKELIDNF